MKLFQNKRQIAGATGIAVSVIDIIVCAIVLAETDNPTTTKGTLAGIFLGLAFIVVSLGIHMWGTLQSTPPIPAP